MSNSEEKIIEDAIRRNAAGPELSVLLRSKASGNMKSLRRQSMTAPQTRTAGFSAKDFRSWFRLLRIFLHNTFHRTFRICRSVYSALPRSTMTMSQLQRWFRLILFAVRSSIKSFRSLPKKMTGRGMSRKPV